jgi:DUF4097 and DUF4098 domain-containing protein YvlB
MKKNSLIPLFGITILVISLPVMVFGATETSHTERSFPATPGGKVMVDASFHMIEVTARPGNSVDVVVDLEFSASEDKAKRLLEEYNPRFEIDGGTIVIRSTRKKATWNWGSYKSKGMISVSMPPGMDLVVDNSSGAVILKGDFGEATVAVDNSSGNISGQTAMAVLSVNNSSGQTRIRAIRPLKQFDVDCSSGSVRLEGGAFKVDVDSSSGSVKLFGLLGDARVDSSSGSVEAVWQSIPAGAIVKIDTSSGGVRLAFPSGTVFKGTIDTSSGGIRTEFPCAVKKRNFCRFNGGSDAVRLSIDTSSGGVRLTSIN